MSGFECQIMNTLSRYKIQMNPFLWIWIITGCFTFFVSPCSAQKQKAKYLNTIDSMDHGYNELANPENRKYFPTSDYNTDNPKFKNIARPSKSIVQTQLDTSLLFGTWTSDPKGEHADFELTESYFFVVDYDGNGDMPYVLQGNQIRIYYNDFIQDGEIIAVSKEYLKVRWAGFEHINTYARWNR